MDFCVFLLIMNSKTPSKSTIAITSDQTSNLAGNLKSTTPKSHKTSFEGDQNFNSPVFSQFSQEECENFDVIWDWNLTQNKTRPRKQKRLDFAQSPEFTIKRPPSNNHISNFVKLKEELETLRDDICSNTVNSTGECSTVRKDVENVFEFDDSMEDQLLVCSQEVEKKVKLLNFPLTPPSHGITDITFKATNIKKTEVNSILMELDDTLEKFTNDSFDLFLQDVKDQESNWVSHSKELDTAENKNACQTVQENSLIHSKQIEHGIRLIKPLCTTILAENVLVNGDSYIGSLSLKNSDHTDKTPTIEEEIERKRQEALMKLESKKKQTSTDGDSPIKCSPEEIEQKRLQAVAKLQAKKKQEIIERNRLEAVKRLEFNKNKRAKLFENSSVSHKLNL